MKVPRTGNINLRPIAAVAALLLAPALSAIAGEAALPEGRPAAPCAVLERFEGEVQILNPNRNDLVYTNLHAGIPCGGWVTVHQGWAHLRHKDGHVLRMAPDTFMEIFDPTGNPAGKSPNQVVLYRGRLWIDVPTGTPDARVLTANGLARIAQGSALVVYSQNEEETQLLSLRNTAWLSNRFLSERPIAVQAGEVSTLNLKLERVVPTSPAPVAFASVKQLLAGVPIDARDRDRAIAAVQKRLDRRFAQEPKGRSIASTPAKKGHAGESEADRYARYPASAADVPQARREWVSHLTGGEPGSEKMLNPKTVSRARKPKVSVEETAIAEDRKRFREEEAEKKELIDELSKIRAE